MLDRIKKRNEARIAVVDDTSSYETNVVDVLLLISQSIDDYLEHRITADKTLEGILKDIQANTERIAFKDQVHGD